MKKQVFEDNLNIWKSLYNIDEKTLGALFADIVKRNTPYNKLLLLSVKPWFVFLVSVFEKIFTLKNHSNFDDRNVDFFFVTCIDPFHRVKALSSIAGNLTFTKFFLPTTTRPKVVRQYYRYYKSTKEQAYFGTFSAADILKYKKFLKDNKGIFNLIKCDNKEDYYLLKYYLMRFGLYRIYAQRVFSNANNDSLWLFEHDKFYFIPIIEYFHRRNILTTQLQHGTFYNPITSVFLPLYTDKILCCSNREKDLYIEGGVQKKDIYVVGAPLQTINCRLLDAFDIKYDILVLLTATSVALSMMKTLLLYLKEHCANEKVLLRFRPRSKQTDRIALLNYIDGFAISEGTSLMEDIASSQKVISFSEDAIFEVISAGKEFVSFVDKSYLYKNYLDGICYPIDRIDEGMEKLMNQPNSISHKDRYIDIYGETDIKIISQNFVSIINQLKGSRNEN